MNRETDQSTKDGAGAIGIRPMCEADLAQAAAYEQMLFSEPWSRAALSDALKRADSVYVAAEGKSGLIGYCGLYLAGEEGYINQVAVSPAYQGMGIGKRMLSHLLETAEQRGMRACTLEVRLSNTRAIALYTGLGFEKAGIRPRFYQKPTEDALILWRYERKAGGEIDGPVAGSNESESEE